MALRIIVKSNRSHTAGTADGKKGLVRIAVGSHVANNVHATAYTTNTGKWGVLVAELGKHTCDESCQVKTELIGVAAGVKTLGVWPTTLTIASCVAKTTEILTLIRNNRRVPEGICDAPLDALVTAEFTRLAANRWVTVTDAAAPGTEARTMAHQIHHYAVGGGSKTPSSALASELAKLAKNAFIR